MSEQMGDPDCQYCKGEGCVREPDDTGCVHWVGCVCLNRLKDDYPFIEDLIDSAGALK